MKKILAAAAVASLAGLTACSVSTPAPGTTTQATASSPSSTETSQAAPSGSVAPSARGAKALCEQFNSLYADYKAIKGDANAYEDIYVQAQDAKDAATGNLVGLFSSLSVLALDHSSAVESAGEVGQQSKDMVRDAVFANANECTAEGVTLTL